MIGILNSNGRKYFVEDLHISSTIRIYETREVINLKTSEVLRRKL